MGKHVRRSSARLRFARLDRWMAVHLQTDLGVGALADRTLMTPRSFARRYREVMGRTSTKTAERLRLDAALALLEEVVDLPPGTARIAHACGFGCERTFIRAFRRWYGLSPVAWVEHAIRQREGHMTDEERDQLLEQIDDRVLCLSVHLDRQVALILDVLFVQLDRIERLVGGNPPPHYPPGEDTPGDNPPVEPPVEPTDGTPPGP